MLKAFLWANTTQKAPKSKKGQRFSKMTKKKKRFYAIMLQIHFIECMKPTKSNPI